MPSADVNKVGWMPNSTAAHRAATLSPTYAPIAAAAGRRVEVSDSERASTLYTAYPTKGMTKAMLKQLAPKARTPPSPKNRAWMARATLTAITAAHGPSMTATSTPPTAWAVVPSGIGTLNIITRKQ